MSDIEKLLHGIPNEREYARAIMGTWPTLEEELIEALKTSYDIVCSRLSIRLGKEKTTMDIWVPVPFRHRVRGAWPTVEVLYQRDLQRFTRIMYQEPGEDYYLLELPADL